MKLGTFILNYSNSLSKFRYILLSKRLRYYTIGRDECRNKLIGYCTGGQLLLFDSDYSFSSHVFTMFLSRNTALHVSSVTESTI